MLSAVVLSGGKSLRMGTDKASLCIAGMTMLDFQVMKLRHMHISDIMVSGHAVSDNEIKMVNDVYHGKGPLSGIYSALLNAVYDDCLVVSVDTPLIPTGLLSELVSLHARSRPLVTLALHGNRIEPLIGVYNKATLHAIKGILLSDNYSVKNLFSKVDYITYRYDGDDILFSNCNTMSDFEKIKEYIDENGTIMLFN